MRVINLIPENYEGDPKQAMGYAWTKIVMAKWDVDLENSIPGEDLNINLAECLALLEKDHGKLVVVDDSAKQPKDLVKVATINGMWCGGPQVTVYAAPAESTETAIAERPEITAGSTLAETAAQVKTAEKIELEESDRRNEDHPGYCKKCHSFCYGDCDANG